MKIERVDPELVTVPHRLRAVESERIDKLAESMKALGLQQPITVWSHSEDHLELVAGAHRLAAAQKLGWSEIDAIFADDMDEIDRQLWEIDENLMRAELSPTEQAEHLSRRQQLWADKKKREQDVAAQQSGATCTTLETGRGNKQFAAETAEKTGVNKSTVSRAMARADAIPEDVRALIKGTRLDKGIYLDGLKGLTHEQQRVKVRHDLAEPPKPKVVSVTDADEEQTEALKRAWNKASSEARRRFLLWIEDEEAPVFDRAASGAA